MAYKVDRNQKEIVDAARKLGATVQILAAVGKGCPDLLIGWRGKNYLCEIKDGRKPPSAQRLTEDQVKWHKKWNGQITIVRSIDDVVRLLN